MTAGVVVVGASLAGAHTALALRRLGFEAPITLVGAEHRLPYERPELSKGFLAGTVSEEALLVAARQDYDDQGITLRLGATATGLRLDRRRLLLQDDAGHDELPYDALVVATGSANVRPPIPGLGLPGVHQVRTLDDAESLAAAATGAGRAVVVGMGLVGCEITATLSGLGLQVTAVDALPGPLWAVLGAELSAVVRRWHEDHGVTLIGGVGVAAVEGRNQVERVLLADGRSLHADLVVVGVGARANVGWLHEAPVHLAAGGLGVDQLLRTNADNVYAAGDVAAVWQPERQSHRRTEHYGSAIDQAHRVAHAILGLDVPPADTGWFWSSQYGRYLQHAGERGPGDRLVTRNDPFAAFFLAGDVLTAVTTVDNGRDLRRAMKLIGRTVKTDQLTDPSVDLRTLA